MKNFTNKLSISILLMVLVAFVLGTTTYAWITLSNTARINPFQATVSAGEGIEMSLDGENFFSNLSEEDIEDFLFTGVSPKYPNFKFNAVTSQDGINMAGYNGQTALGYIEFDLTLRTPDWETPDIYWVGVTLESEGIPWTPDVPFTNAKGVSLTTASGSTNYYVADAARISVQGNISTVIYELGITDTNSVLGAKINFDLTNENGSVDYFIAKNTAAPEGVTTVTVPSAVTTIETLDTTALVILNTPHDPVDNFNYGTITIRIWIEGWDPDCFNSILRGVLNIELIFEKPTV